MGNGDVASLNAQREYMGNVMVLVNKKSLNKKSLNPAEQLFCRGGEKLKFLVPFASFYSLRKPT